MTAQNASDLRDVDLDLLCRAIECVAGRQFVSLQTFQRAFHVGFAKAARLLYALEACGVIDESFIRGHGWRVLLPPDQVPTKIAELRKAAA